MTINVVYLSYYNESAGYDLSWLERFLGSYKKNYAGMKHNFTIIAKNWTDKTQYKMLCKRAAEVNAKIIDLPDDGWDFGAYFRVAELLNDEYLFFIGTASLINSPNWLSYSYNAFKSDESIQLVGSMGSGGYVDKAKTEVFPNYHIRTCSFMIKRELFAQYAASQKFPVTKEDTYDFEHGENSITNFVLNKGYKAVVVNNLGEIYLPSDWVFSETFRCPTPSKALIGDKHSRFYYTKDDEFRRFLERAAWGWSLKQTKIKIFVAYHRPAKTLESEVFLPIFNGANEYKSNTYALRDNVGTNISEKNNRYRELTGHYWVWKNILPRIDTEYIGFFHYHRFLDFDISFANNTPFLNANLQEFKPMCGEYSEYNIIKCLGDNDAILPHKYYCEQSIYELYAASSPVEDLDLALDILKEIHPEYIESAKKVVSGNELYACLIFVMKRELVCEYMEWIFSILTVLEQKIDWSKHDKSVSSKTLVNIAEIFFNIWLVHNAEIKNLKIAETGSVFVEGM